MNVTNVDEKLQGIIEKIIRMNLMDFSMEKKSVNSGYDLMDDLGMDSLMMVQLIVEIENNFDIEFDLEVLDINVLRKYEQLKNYILEQIN